MPKMRKIDGQWREVNKRSVKVGRVWRKVKTSFRKINGEWKKVYTDAINAIDASEVEDIDGINRGII